MWRHIQDSQYCRDCKTVFPNFPKKGNQEKKVYKLGAPLHESVNAVQYKFCYGIFNLGTNVLKQGTAVPTITITMFWIR